MVTGSLISPTIFQNLGALGSFGVYFACSSLALVYMLKYVKEPEIKNTG